MVRLPGLQRGLFCFFLLICLHGTAAAQAGREMLSLHTVAARLGMDVQVMEKGKRWELHSEWTRIWFAKDRRDIRLNGTRLFLGFPVAEKRGRLYLTEADYQGCLQPLLTPQVFAPPGPVRRIVLDPGHGGKDPGARRMSLGLIEKNLTLDLAKRLARRLRAAGFEVVLTRDKDRFLALSERPQLANKVRTDLFLSLHVNASEKEDVAGVETFVLTPQGQPSTGRLRITATDRKEHRGNRQDARNMLLGFYVQRALVEKLPSPDRGLKRARFAVLRDLRMPGILIEAGFLSHARESRNLGSAAYRNRIADAIMEGVRAYLRTAERLQKKKQQQP